MSTGGLDRRAWLVSRRYDLTWFFGAAVMAVALVPALFAVGVPIAALFWGWLLLVDGPHIGATLVRTYVDRDEWRERGPLLAWSLLAFLVGPAFVLANVVTGSKDPFTLFLGLAAFYGFYHVVRQHYGFLALYGGVNRARVDALDRWCLYVGCWTPYLYFLLVHPLARKLVSLPPELGPMEAVLAWACAGAYALALGTYVLRARGKPATCVAYVLTVLVAYGVIYLGVARLEPVYPAARGPDEAFMLISVMTALFHGVQYVALVWVHNRNRYSEPGVDYGLARPLNASATRYTGTLVAFSAGFYLLAAAATGVFPGLHPWSEATLGPVSVNELGLCLWWGLALHHYVVDARIWRVSGDARLKRHLGLG
jgi:hypothetical protein